jgi:flagellar hook assembly protein FlgD
MTARDKFNNKVTIPVVMHVEDTTIIIGVPSGDALGFRAFPNPFTDQTGFRYTLASKQSVTACIADYSGKVVRTLISKEQHAGTYILTWDGKNENGFETAPGFYIFRMQAGGKIITEKLVHLY